VLLLLTEKIFTSPHPTFSTVLLNLQHYSDSWYHLLNDKATWHGDIFYTVKPCGGEPSSCLLSSENGGIRHSNVLLSCRSILNVPLSISTSHTIRCIPEFQHITDSDVPLSTSTSHTVRCKPEYQHITQSDITPNISTLHTVSHTREYQHITHTIKRWTYKRQLMSCP